MGDDIVSLDARAVQATVSVVSRVGLADLARLAPWDKGTLAELLVAFRDRSSRCSVVAPGGRGEPGVTV